MFRSTLMFTTSLMLFGFAAAHAQAPTAASPGGGADMMHMMALGAHNQLGVVEFCQANGNLGADTVALQQKMIGMLPPSSTDGLDAAEATGKTGVISFGGTQTSLPEAAKAQGTTVAVLCGKIGYALAQAAKSLPQ